VQVIMQDKIMSMMSELVMPSTAPPELLARMVDVINVYLKHDYQLRFEYMDMCEEKLKEPGWHMNYARLLQQLIQQAQQDKEPVSVGSGCVGGVWLRQGRARGVVGRGVARPQEHHCRLRTWGNSHHQAESYQPPGGLCVHWQHVCPAAAPGVFACFWRLRCCSTGVQHMGSLALPCLLTGAV
jgi:hypothetical protein